MTATVSPARVDIFTQLRAFILGVITCEVVQGLGNGTVMPLGGFIAITPLFQNRLATNVNTYADPTPTTGTKDSLQAVRYTVQIDAFGATSSDWATIISTAFRDEYACVALGPNVQPLFCDDPKMIPLVDGEGQWNERWSITAYMQYNPVVTTPMQFFDDPVVG
ncbi:MAG: hypothetical protein B7X10_04755, partial [Burkholderiales bacterium 21-58-4]